MGSISSFFGYILNWLYNIFGNYGIAIIVFSVLLRLALVPLTYKQQRTMKKSAEMQEKLKQIQFKYKNDPEKLNKETIALYKTEKISPFSGCLTVFLQLFIFLSVFYLVSSPLTYMKKVDQDIINKYKEELATDNPREARYSEIEIIQKKGEENPEVFINMNFLGLDLSKVPRQNMTDFSVYIIPALYVVTSFISIRLTSIMQKKLQAKEKDKEDDIIGTTEKIEEVIEKKEKEENNEEKIKEDNNDVDVIEEKEETGKNKSKDLMKKEDDQAEILDSMQQMSKTMNYMMPIMSISIAFITPLGLALYWLVSNFLMIVERLVINKITERDEKKSK